MAHVTQTFRLAKGGQVDREAALDFRFDGRAMQGLQGDTLASALLANGVRLAGRSFKFHRPRGILSAGAEEPNALVRVGEGGYAEPNVRATMQPLYDGLVATSQNCWPSLKHDFGALFDLTAGLWPAGFYNKTFKWPDWHWYEGAIRRAAGLGRLPEATDPDRYCQRNVHCDVLICGAGPAGLAAALSAGRSGARVILVEQDSEAGGSLLWQAGEVDEKPGTAWAADAVEQLRSRDNVLVLNRTTVAGCFDHNVFVLVERRHQRHETVDGPRERLWIVRAKEVIVATGAIEQPLPFPGNDRPGVMLASAVQHYALRYGVAAGNGIVVVTNNNSGYRAALAMTEAGVKVTAVIDCRAGAGSALPAAVRARGIEIHSNCIPVATLGRHSVRSVTVVSRDGNGTAAQIACDCIAMSGGWQPTVHLVSQNRGKLLYDSGLGAFLPESVPRHMCVVGAANGNFTLAKALVAGDHAGLSASSAAGFHPNPYTMAPQSGDAHASVHADKSVSGFFLQPEKKPNAVFVDFQHDVTLRDIDIAVRENYVSVEHVKRYTTTGMSIDQGKTSNLNALIALAERTRREPSQVGTTTFRPFYTPVTLGAIAGRRLGTFYAPARQSPLSVVATEHGARFQDYGNWSRPAAFPRGDEDLDAAILREARHVRRSAGIFDASPLGKIEVQGPDAATFLDRIYVNNIKALPVGRARYAIMLNDNGVIMDDGIVVRMADESYLLHPSSGNADRVFAWLEEWLQGEWPHLQILLTPVTSQWATIALAGPLSPNVLAMVAPSLATADIEFPHMAWRAAEIGSIPGRVLRASFTGELGYEISVPARHGETVWRALLAADGDFQVTPFGVESLMVLRTEKGFLHVGSDTDGNTTADDIGWGDIVTRKSADFIGKRSLQRPHNRRADRLQLVGLEPAQPQDAIAVGAHIVGPDISHAPAPTQGYVTSACFSPNLERWIALGLVRAGRTRIDEAVNLFHADQIVPARIVTPKFL